MVYQTMKQFDEAFFPKAVEAACLEALKRNPKEYGRHLARLTIQLIKERTVKDVE